MQAVHLNPALIKKEAGALGLSSEAAENYVKSTLCHFIKLRKFPVSKILQLKQTAAVYSILVLKPEAIEPHIGDSNIIIAGTEEGLIKLCAKLDDIEGAPALAGRAISLALNKLHKKKEDALVLGDHILPLGTRTLIMGILNITPDSFSDGGHFKQIESALAQAYKMAEEGADIIDIGGESTRPGHEMISVEEELKRVMPVVTALKKDLSFKLPLSIDTYKAVVAERALEAGVEMLNDVWGLKADSELGRVAARYEVPICMMHNRDNTRYEDLIPDIIADLEESIELAHRAGIEDKRIIIDPGIGFGKDLQQNLDVMLHLREFCNLGYPLLLGTSRKSMIGKTLDLPVDERLEGTAATVTCGIIAGADIVRVHDVLAMRRTAIMTDAMCRR